jgi:D-tyrosyl-tRNA(Tyr) deacylase
VRAVLQRVSSASVIVGPETVGQIGAGLLVLLGVDRDDVEADADRLAGRTARLRIFGDADGRFDRSLLDVQGAALVVSQFTLIAETEKGTRPSFARAARPEPAFALYERYCVALAAVGVGRVERGRFGAAMAVALVGDGPITIVLDSRSR